LNNQTNLTPEQYKTEVLKRRIAELVANYEEMLANQATSLAQLQAQLEDSQGEVARLREQVPADEKKKTGKAE
jgi:Tfp pilus assembly protein PilO